MVIGIVFALAVGGATGLRTFSALAVLLFARRDWVSALAGVALLGELIGDLIPGVPARTSIGPLIGRALVGGYCAALVGARTGLPLWAGAICGALGAVVFAHLGLNWRLRAAPALKLPPVAAAVLEDIVAIGGAIAVIGI